ncbi:MAG: DciA family protein [Candidatus Magasanikiibacteriota bacterium]
MESQSQTNKLQKDDEFIAHVKECLVSIFKSEIAEKINPLFLKNRTLTVSCSNSEIAQQVRENQEEIVKKINLKLGKKEVDRIRYLL